MLSSPAVIASEDYPLSGASAHLILDSPDGRLTSVLVPYVAGVLGSICLVFAFRRFLRA